MYGREYIKIHFTHTRVRSRAHTHGDIQIYIIKIYQYNSTLFFKKRGGCFIDIKSPTVYKKAC